MPSSVGVAVVCTFAGVRPGLRFGQARTRTASSRRAARAATSPAAPWCRTGAAPGTPMLWWAFTNTATLASCPPRTSIVLQVLLLVEAEAAELGRDGHAVARRGRRGRWITASGMRASRSIFTSSMWASANARTFAAISSARAASSGGSVGYGNSRSPRNLPKNRALAKPRSGPAMSSSTCFFCSAICGARESHENPRGKVIRYCTPRGQAKGGRTRNETISRRGFRPVQ